MLKLTDIGILCKPALGFRVGVGLLSFSTGGKGNYSAACVLNSALNDFFKRFIIDAGLT